MSIFWPKIIFSKLPKNMLFLGMENCILSLSGVRKVFWCFVKGTCLRLSWFPFFFSFFYDHFSLWTFGGSTGNFFSGSQSLLSFSGSLKLRFSFTGKTQKALLTRKKNSLSHHQMSFWKSSRQKKMETSFAEGSSFLMHQKNFTYPRKIQEQTIVRVRLKIAHWQVTHR